MRPNAVTLDDKFDQLEGQVFLTGLQALVRLPIMQRRRDLDAGLNTAGYVTGYRGSPVGRYDLELWRAKKHLEENHIKFLPAVNEDLGATAVWGTQEVGVFPNAKYDGVFSIWYGKGPGLARSVDVFKHANLAGAWGKGGVLAVVGDDPGATSSAFANPSEFTFMDIMMPVIHPAGIEEFIELGLHGFALSRFCGLWVGFKTEADTVESSGTIMLASEKPEIIIPANFVMPDGGLNTRVGEFAMPAEYRQYHYKLDAARAYARANNLNRVVIDPPKARLGIAASGKSYMDVRQALRLLGIDDDRAEALGIRVFKLGMIWPLEPAGVDDFASGLDEILIVEEKRAFIETQIKEHFYNDRANAPRIVGKTDENGHPLLPEHGVHTPEMVARAIGERLLGLTGDESLRNRLEGLHMPGTHTGSEAITVRTPYFCSGCPHNTSTKVPDGSRAVGGVGCHFMAAFMDRNVHGWTHMGGEGATWIGQSPFTETEHVFQSLGDGTYFHSGLMAIRAAIAAEVNITYKLLFNDAVAMTGGQPVDGPLSVPMITRQVAAEGVERIAVVSDEPNKYPSGSDFAPGVTFHHRSELNEVQKELREWPGVTVMVYDQVCAAEKRRRRKRGTFPDPDKRIFINTDVCEGCGDCVVASNCLSVVPVDTEFGSKRAIEQFSCNKDYSCLNGFCPALVTVEGGKPKRAAGPDLATLADPPAPARADTQTPFSILVTGVGGTGVITVGAIVGMAAHIEGRAVTILDNTGMSQKGGAVMSHIRVADRQQDLDSTRIAAGAADLVLGCDGVVASTGGVLDAMAEGKTQAVLNMHKMITADNVRDRTFDFDMARMAALVEGTVGSDAVDRVDANRLAGALMGDTVAANTLMLGYAVQKGLIPVSLDALEQAFRLNGVAVEGNLQALRLGRIAAHDMGAIEELLSATAGSVPAEPETLQTIVDRRASELTRYQDAAYAQRYRALVERVRSAEEAVAAGKTDLAEAVARYYYKLLAYKDEYEVARLYTNGRFEKRLAGAFDGDLKVTYHLAPPILNRPGADGRPQKRALRHSVRLLFPLLAKLKRLRGTRLDPFGYNHERKVERGLIAEYEAVVEALIAGLDAGNHNLAVEIARLPDEIRGYGPVKDTSITKTKAREADLLAQFRDPASAPTARAAE